MTTKIIVADDTIGRIAKRQHDLLRRVLEGGLDPKKILDGLQLLSDGKSIPYTGVHPLETYPFVLSEKRYRFKVDRSVPVLKLAVEAGLSIDQWRKDIDTETFNSSGSHTKGVYSLVRFTAHTNWEVTLPLFKECDIEVTDIWELVTAAKLITQIRLPRGAFRIWAPGAVSDHVKWKSIWSIDHRNERWHPKELRPFSDESGISPDNYALVRHL